MLHTDKRTDKQTNKQTNKHTDKHRQKHIPPGGGQLEALRSYSANLCQQYIMPYA